MKRSRHPRTAARALTAALLVPAGWMALPPAAAGAPADAAPSPRSLTSLPAAVPDLTGVAPRLVSGPRTRTGGRVRLLTASSSAATCRGRRATIVGTRRGDRIRGTGGRDVIVGGGGDDRIRGLGGGDVVCGSGGDDYLSAGGGKDRVDGGGGNDTLAASAGRDRLSGGAGVDWLDFRDSRRGVRVDLARGSGAGERWSSVESVVGSRRDDRITGTARADQLRGGGGDDVLTGLGGDDVIAGQGGDDTVDGGEGLLDIVVHPTSPRSVTVDLAAGRVTGDGTDRLVGIEGAVGSRHADTLSGGGETSVLAGGPGNDRILGTGATDVLLPLEPGAVVDLGAQRATSEGTDTVSGIEVLVGTSGDDRLTGSDADEVIVAGPGTDTVAGNGGSDILVGGDDADTLLGGTGEDVLRGDVAAEAADRLEGGDGADVADYGSSTAAVTVDLVAGSGPAGDRLVGVEMVAGSPHADTITGDGGNNTLMGAGGGDVLTGGDGNDVVSGGPGVDSLLGGVGSDYLTGDDDSAGADGGEGSDVCVGVSPAVACEASEFTGGQAPGSTLRSRAAPEPGSRTRSAREAPEQQAVQARAPWGDWIGYGNPLVNCNDGLPSTSAVVTAHLPARVRPDYASANQQTVWLRQEIFDLFNPNAPIQTSSWFYNVLNPDQWTTNWWYLYQGRGNDPLDAWYTNFGRNYAVNYAVVYDMWWQDNVTGQWLYHSRFRAWHTSGRDVWWSDRCAAQALGYFNGSPNASTPTCSYNWSDTFCAVYRSYFSSFSTPFLYPNSTFRKRR